MNMEEALFWVQLFLYIAQTAILISMAVLTKRYQKGIEKSWGKHEKRIQEIFKEYDES